MKAKYSYLVGNLTGTDSLMIFSILIHVSLKHNPIESMTWYRPEFSGIPPTSRVSTTGCLVGSKIYFFGGYDGMQWLNDVHAIDLGNELLF
jgi:hypothetical protein